MSLDSGSRITSGMFLSILSDIRLRETYIQIIINTNLRSHSNTIRIVNEFIHLPSTRSKSKIPEEDSQLKVDLLTIICAAILKPKNSHKINT